MSTHLSQIPANIRAEAARYGRSQSRVASDVGMSWSTWQRRMDDPRSFTIGELAAIAEALGVPLEHIWTPS